MRWIAIPNFSKKSPQFFKTQKSVSVKPSTSGYFGWTYCCMNGVSNKGS